MVTNMLLMHIYKVCGLIMRGVVPCEKPTVTTILAYIG